MPRRPQKCATPDPAVRIACALERLNEELCALHQSVYALRERFPPPDLASLGKAVETLQAPTEALADAVKANTPIS